MGGFGEFGGQILAGPVQLFVQASAPFGAIGHIVNDAVMGNVGWYAIAVVVEAKLSGGEGWFGHYRFSLLSAVFLVSVEIRAVVTISSGCLTTEAVTTKL